MGRAGTLALSAGAELRSTYPVTYFSGELQCRHTEVLTDTCTS